MLGVLLFPPRLPLQQEFRLMPASIILSGEQQCAILTPGDLFVRAGAGSGKTEVLARRFVALLAGDIEGSPPLAPERIAAVTFSEKAAHDMRTRIAAVLAERIAQASDEAARTHLLRAQRTLPLARISTLHAFCARILRENALAAGLDPAFDIIDEYQSAVFLERETEQALLAAIRSDDPGALLLAAMRGLHGSTHREGALPIVMRLMGELSRAGHDAAWLRDRTREAVERILAQQDQINHIACRLAGLVDSLVALPNFTGKAADKVAALRLEWPKLQPVLRGFAAYSSPGASEALRRLLELLPEARGAAIKPIIEDLRKLLNAKGAFELGGELIEAWGAYRAARPSRAVADLLVLIQDALAEAKRRDAVVTFDDLLLLTRRLLADSTAVVKRYQESLGALLVDEFQDTDPIQDEILERLCSSSAGGVMPSLFIVGDEKQSIYRFRGADITVFDRRRKRTTRVLPLSRNRRSTPHIVAFANAFGASIMRAGSDPAPRHWVQWAPEHDLIADRGDGFDPAVQILRSCAASDAGTGRKFEAQVVAQHIHDLIDRNLPVFDATLGANRPIAYRDIAILMRAFTDVAIYERALRAAGIPFYTVKGRGLFGSQEVIDLVELLTAINDPRDSLALAAALRSPFFTLSDDALLELALDLHERDSSPGPSALADLFAGDEPPDFGWLKRDRAEAEQAWRVLHELRAARDRLTVTAMIEQAIELTGFETVMFAVDPSGQRSANLHRLIELARSFETHQFFTFHDFVAYLRRLAEEEPREPQAQILGENENVVRLMTVHQAKGLEFPLVVVADMWRQLPRANPQPLISPHAGLVLCDTIGSGYDEIPNRALTELRNEIYDQELAESARLLYVAITRARDHLILSAAGRAKGGIQGTWGRLLEDFLKGLDIALDDSSAGDGQPQSFMHGDLSLVLISPNAAPSTASPRGASVIPPAERDRFAAIARSRMDFVPPPPDSLVLSPTELEVLARCPREYYWRYLAKLPPSHEYSGGWQAGADADPDDSLLMGLAAHAILEQLDFGPAGLVAPSEFARTAVAAASEYQLTPAGQARLVNDLGRYLMELRFPADATIEREVPFFLRASDDPELFVRGRIDVMCVTTSSVTIRDYKYARPSDSSAYQLQMEIYALAVAEAYGGREVSAELIFLREGPVVRPIELRALTAIQSQLQVLAREFIAAQSSLEWIKRPSNVSACRRLRCGYIPQCWMGLT
jgi:ATP-dependent helicase/nuclease subunit A